MYEAVEGVGLHNPSSGRCVHTVPLAIVVTIGQSVAIVASAHEHCHKVPLARLDLQAVAPGLGSGSPPEGESYYRVPTSIDNSVRFNWPHMSGESQQFIQTINEEALTLPLSTV